MVQIFQYQAVHPPNSYTYILLLPIPIVTTVNNIFGDKYPCNVRFKYLFFITDFDELSIKMHWCTSINSLIYHKYTYIMYYCLFNQYFLNWNGRKNSLQHFCYWCLYIYIRFAGDTHKVLQALSRYFICIFYLLNESFRREKAWSTENRRGSILNVFNTNM